MKTSSIRCCDNFIAAASEASPNPVVEEPDGVDDYGREIAVCMLEGVELNAEMLSRGLAWAFVRFSADHVSHGASGEHTVGVWQADTETPWDLGLS